MDFNAWIRQPSTIHGIGVIAAGIGTALSQLATGNPTLDAVVAVIAYAFVHLGIDDHSVAEQAVAQVATDAVNAAQGKPVSAGKAITDATGAVSAVQSAP